MKKQVGFIIISKTLISQYLRAEYYYFENWSCLEVSTTSVKNDFCMQISINISLH